MLQYAEAKEIFSYDPDSGIIRWKVYRGRNGGRAQPGSIAGCTNSDTGYMVIRYNKKLYKAHRLAWLLYYGTDAPTIIDHINRNKTDNRIENLRLATKSENTTNSGRHFDNKLGHKNISVKDGRLRVQIQKNAHRVDKTFSLNDLDAAISYRNSQLALLHGSYANVD